MRQAYPKALQAVVIDKSGMSAYVLKYTYGPYKLSVPVIYNPIYLCIIRGTYKKQIFAAECPRTHQSPYGHSPQTAMQIIAFISVKVKKMYVYLQVVFTHVSRLKKHGTLSAILLK